MGVLINSVTETIKDKIQGGGFSRAVLAPLNVLFVQPRISSVIKAISGRGVRRARKGHIDKNFQFHLILFHFFILPIMNLGLMGFFKKEFTYNKRGTICDKSWWNK